MNCGHHQPRIHLLRCIYECMWFCASWCHWDLLTCSIFSASIKNSDTGEQARYQDTYQDSRNDSMWDHYAIDIYCGIVTWSKKASSISLACDVSRSCGSYFAWILSFNLYHSLWGRYYSSEFNSWGSKSSERLSNLTKIAQFGRRRYFKRGSAAYLCT